MPRCECCEKEVNKTKRFMLPKHVYNHVCDEVCEHLEHYYCTESIYVCESCAETIFNFIQLAKCSRIKERKIPYFVSPNGIVITQEWQIDSELKDKKAIEIYGEICQKINELYSLQYHKSK